MSGRRYRDFDAMWDELHLEPISIKVMGTHHVLPPRLPARIVLRAERLEKERGEDGEITTAELVELARDFFGSQRVEAWFDEGMSVEQLTDVFQGSMQLYSERAGREGDGEPEGEATAPEVGAHQNSSSTGESLKPTSSASTG